MQRNPDLVAAERYGIFMPGVMDFIKPEWKQNYTLAMDAQPSLVTQPNSGIPAFLTTFVDPDILRILTSKNAAAEIFGEVRKGSWTDVTVVFPVVEPTGEVSSYGDFSAGGKSGANMNFPQREAYLYQTHAEYGELEMERAGLAKIGWAEQVKQASITTLNKFQNLTYFKGVDGLQNYGLLNDPGLSAPIAPAAKAAGGVAWFSNGAPNATANEVYNDIVSMFALVQKQAGGNVDQKGSMTLAMSPTSAVAMTFTNGFGITVAKMMKESFPGMEIKTAVQYGALSAQNPQGSAAGEVVQLIVRNVEGQETGYCAFNEKLRAGNVVVGESSWRQKMTQGTLGAVVRQPFAIAQMLGV